MLPVTRLKADDYKRVERAGERASLHVSLFLISLQLKVR